MKVKLFAAATLVVMGTFVAQARAAEQTWTVTTTGFIGGGHDSTGVFGNAGEDLAGRLFTQTITASIDPATWQTTYGSDTYVQLTGRGPGFTDTVTVNGHSVTFTGTWTASGYSGSQSISNSTYQGKLSAYGDAVRTAQSGYTSDGSWLQIWNNAYSDTTPFVSSLNFDQSLFQDTANGQVTINAYFAVSGNQSAHFSAYAQSISVNVSAVPEPETYAMLLAGLGLVGFAARRKRISV